MGILNDVFLGYWPKPNYPSNQRRKLTVEDRAGWADAQDGRGHSISRKPQTLDDVRKLVRNRNPIRWLQLQRDFKWVQKEMKKLGLNPEDARYIL